MWIKICGIRDIQSAQAAAEAGADAIGLNFYAQSPRVVAPDIATAIVAGLAGAAEPVGVFVNNSAAEVRAICRQCGLRTVQLHGDEPPELVAELSRDFRVIRAFRVGAEAISRNPSISGCMPAARRPALGLSDRCQGTRKVWRYGANGPMGNARTRIQIGRMASIDFGRWPATRQRSAGDRYSRSLGSRRRRWSGVVGRLQRHCVGATVRRQCESCFFTQDQLRHG